MKPNIEINKPLCFIKVKTTGNDPYKDRITELAITKFENGKEPLAVTRRYSTPETVPPTADGKIALFETKAKALNEFFKDCGFIGYNIRNSDLIFLVQEFNRSGEIFSLYNRKIVDLYTMYNKMNPASFESIYEKYCGTKIGGDIPSSDYVFNSVELFNAMLAKVDKPEINIDKLANWFNPKANSLDCKGLIILNADNRPVFNFGPHNGKVVSETCLNDNQYFQFLTTSSDIPRDTIQVIKSIVAKAQKQVQ